jgi:hypothetical protein
MSDHKPLVVNGLPALVAIVPVSWVRVTPGSPLMNIPVCQIFDADGPRAALAISRGNLELRDAFESARTSR